MKKTWIEIIEKIGTYTIIRGFDTAPINPPATEAVVRQAIKTNPALAETNQRTLWDTYAVYSEDFGERGRAITEAQYAEHKKLLDKLGKHQLLTDDLQIIPDFRDVEYWLQQGGRWAKTKMGKDENQIGQPLPNGAFLEEDLSPEAKEAIAVQNEADRIAALTPEAKQAEKAARLDSLADEADRQERRAKIQGKDFDAAVWSQEHKAPIEAKYA
jgi:hypothetical protein